VEHIKTVDFIVQYLEVTHPKVCIKLHENVMDKNIAQPSHILKLA
jgi:hypothetical protein